MFSRIVSPPASASFFLFGPRGTGKTTWLERAFPDAHVFDLLDAATYGELVAHPDRLESLVDPRCSSVVIDEVQKLPSILDEVHRLIEKRRWRFILTGSSARKLRRGGANLLAGRARTVEMHPLTASELGSAFDLRHSLRFGQLPSAYVESDPARYLESYVGTYLREEVRAEALVRNIASFSRFLQAASFSQASPLNAQAVARDCGINRKTVENHFDLLEDLLLAVRLPSFSLRATRAMTTHPKFFFFDAGVYRTIRPTGPLDSPEEIDGPTLETLVMQELRAVNANHAFGYELFHWRTREGREVDFVLYGKRKLLAIEVKRSSSFRDSDTDNVEAFLADYPRASAFLFYGGTRHYRRGRLEVIPLADALPKLPELLE